MTTTTDTPRGDTAPDVLAAFILGVPMAAMGVFTGIIAATQGHTWPWLPPFLAITGAVLIGYGILRSVRLTFGEWVTVMVAGRRFREELGKRARVIWAQDHADPRKAVTLILVLLGAALATGGAAAGSGWLMLSFFGAALVPLVLAYRRLCKSHLPR
jgi:fatty acid desaturase